MEFWVVVVGIGVTLFFFLANRHGWNDLEKLKKGEFGEFTVNSIHHNGSGCIAFDSTRNKIAFLNVEIAQGEEFFRMSFICNYSDISNILISNTEYSAIIDFKLVSEIPRGNQDKRIRFIGSKVNLTKLVTNELQNIPIRVLGANAS